MRVLLSLVFARDKQCRDSNAKQCKRCGLGNGVGVAGICEGYGGGRRHYQSDEKVSDAHVFLR